jgi:hypothetical protein
MYYGWLNRFWLMMMKRRTDRMIAPKITTNHNLNTLTILAPQIVRKDKEYKQMKLLR